MATVRIHAERLPETALRASLSCYGWGTFLLAEDIAVVGNSIDVAVELPLVPLSAQSRLGIVCTLYAASNVIVGRWLGARQGQEFRLRPDGVPGQNIESPTSSDANTGALLGTQVGNAARAAGESSTAALRGSASGRPTRLVLAEFTSRLAVGLPTKSSETT